jgi:hypothetical protein
MGAARLTAAGVPGFEVVFSTTPWRVTAVAKIQDERDHPPGQPA